MAWLKSKTVWMVLGVTLMLGLIVVLIIHHAIRYKGPTHFPKAAWASAGMADPVSALETACWAVRMGDGTTMLASLAPELATPLRNAWKKSKAGKNMTLEDFFAMKTQRPADVVLGFRVLGEWKVNDHKAFVHVYVQGWWHKMTFEMHKIGADWKVAGVSWK